MEKQVSKYFSSKEKAEGTGQADNQAVIYRIPALPGNIVVLLIFLGVRNGWEQQHTDGIWNGGWKQDNGKCHAGQDSKQADGILLGQPITAKGIGNQDCFCTMQEADE